MIDEQGPAQELSLHEGMMQAFQQLGERAGGCVALGVVGCITHRVGMLLWKSWGWYAPIKLACKGPLCATLAFSS